MGAELPEKIGSFKIISELGSGAMGTIYHAMHGTLDRPVALKILPPEFSRNPEYIARFLREARTVAALKHENVVQVYDAGEDNGKYFIAMELVDGSNLEQYLEEKKQLGEKEVLELLLQAAKGLAAAHARGLVHRDIKPENLLLGKDGILRVVDFGLVMESGSTTQLTATGACLGTPMYMSPEQADGTPADARTDIYSLGACFYRIFTGQPPFSAATVMNLLFKHKFHAPADPRTLRPALSQDASNLILHMMAKKREDRPQTALAVVEMIEGLRQGKPIAAPPPFVADGPETIMSTANGATMIAPQTAPAAASVAPAPAAKKRLMFAAAALLVLFALVSIAFAKFRHSDSDIQNLIAQGDAALASGDYSTAADKYRNASAARPANAELKLKLEGSEKALKFDGLMQAAEALESKGQFEAASVQYAEAAGLESGTKAKERLERIHASLAQKDSLSTSQKEGEREQLLKQADAEKLKSNFDAAAELYSRAAALSDASMKSFLLDAATECRRQDYLNGAMAAETLKNFVRAEEYYRKALALKNDPLIAEKLRQLQSRNQETVAIAPASSRQDAPVPVQDGKPIANSQQPAANVPARDNSAAAVKKVDDLVAQQHEDDAAALLNSELAINPDSLNLKSCRAALEQLQAGGRIYSELDNISDAAVERVIEAADIDGDEAIKDHKQNLKNLRTRFTENSHKSRPAFLSHSYALVQTLRNDAHGDASDLAAELTATAKAVENRAARASDEGISIKAPFGIRLGSGGSKKAGKYMKLCEDIRGYAEKTKALQDK